MTDQRSLALVRTLSGAYFANVQMDSFMSQLDEERLVLVLPPMLLI